MMLFDCTDDEAFRYVMLLKRQLRNYSNDLHKMLKKQHLTNYDLDYIDLVKEFMNDIRKELKDLGVR